jgi:uncharacterized protein (DUF1697 family)
VRYAALLRGVNVGGKNRLPMPALRDLLVGLGFTDVETLLQSGNAVFGAGRTSPAKVAARITDGLQEELGLDVTVMVRTHAQLTSIVDANPFAKEAAKEPGKVLVSFLAQPPARGRLDDVDGAALEPERFRLVGSELYLWCPRGVGRSRLVQTLSDKKLGVAATARNWNTVTKLLELTA